MIRFVLCFLFAIGISGAFAQQAAVPGLLKEPVTKANYSLAARFSPKKQEKLLFSTLADVHWLKKSDRFWYVYETTEGKKWWIVDPVKAEKKALFDNEK